MNIIVFIAIFLVLRYYCLFSLASHGPKIKYYDYEQKYEYSSVDGEM